jgi:hypothetical protein
LAEGFGKNVELVGYHDLESKPGFKLAMQVVEEKWYIYLGHFWARGWSIVDVTEPSKPKYVRYIPGPEHTECNQIQVADGIMITALQKELPVPGRPKDAPFEEGFYIWDVKDPENPKRLGHWKSGAQGTHRNHWEGGRYVHCAAQARGFVGQLYVIVDIADPQNPVEVGRWWLPEQWVAGSLNVPDPRLTLHGPAYTRGSRAYLGYGTGGMVILDISDITLPRLVSQLKLHPPLGGKLPCHTVLPLTRRDLAIVTSEAIDEGEESREPMQYAGIVDISDEENPRLISLLPVPEPPPGAPYKNFREKGGRFGPHNFNHPQRQPYLEDRDDRVYVAYFNAGLRVYDISDPYLPREIGYYVPPDPEKRLGPAPFTKLVCQSEDVLVDRRGYIYMTDKNQGLFVMRCTA